MTADAASRAAPGPGPPAFIELLLLRNGLEADGFASWDLLPGMRFGERQAWWRAGAPRDAPHEGLDLRGYRTPAGRLVALGTGARVPVLWAGAVAAVVPDFLGSSVFVAHGCRDGAGRLLHTVYGHLEPAPGIACGSALRQGDEVGAIADPGARKSSVPAHLHLTVAWVAVGRTARLDWSVLHDPARSVLIDPLPLVCATMPPPQRA